MNPKQLLNAFVDPEGRLILPEKMIEKYHLVPGTQIHIEEGINEFHVLRPIEQVAKIYIEVTNMCNLDCVTCMRNIWDEPLGRMSQVTFKTILESISQITPRPKVFFGGLGEPLVHSKIIDMVTEVKKLGSHAELITNGVLLSENIIVQLTKAGLDILWVSLDGASPESYEDVRLGSSLPKVIDNLKRLRLIRHNPGYQHSPKPELGIAFVAMKRNIADLPEVLRLGTRLGAKHFSISNVLPHTEELREDSVFRGVYSHHDYWQNNSLAVVNMPRMDINQHTREALGEIQSRQVVMHLAGKPTNRALDTCPFIEQGSTAVRWDGSVSPCIPLLHSSGNFIGNYHRQTQAHSIGKLENRGLLDLWNYKSYLDFREKVRYFDFSPCTSCTGCDLSRLNVEDCISSPFPTCGGCLYGQGLIQCP